MYTSSTAHGRTQDQPVHQQPGEHTPPTRRLAPSYLKLHRVELSHLHAGEPEAVDREVLLGVGPGGRILVAGARGDDRAALKRPAQADL